MKGYDVHYSNKDFTQTIGGSLFNQELKGREKELFYYVYEAFKYTLRSEQIYTSAIGSRHKYSSPYGRISVTIKGDNTFLVTAIDSWKEVNYIITLGDIDVDITNKEAQAPPLNTNNRVMATIAQNCTLAAKCMAAKTCARAVSNTNSDEFTPEMCYRKKTEEGEFIQVDCPDHFELELWQQWQDTKDKIQHLFSGLANKLSCASL